MSKICLILYKKFQLKCQEYATFELFSYPYDIVQYQIVFHYERNIIHVHACLKPTTF